MHSSDVPDLPPIQSPHSTPEITRFVSYSSFIMQLMVNMDTLIKCCGLFGFGTFLYLYFTNNVVRYYVKHTILIITFTTSASACIPLMLWRPMHYKNALLPSWISKQVGRLLGVRCVVRGHENLVKDTGCVVLLNHQSVVDLLVLAEIWPILGRATMIAKKEIFYMWPFGLACWLWGTMYIDRLNGDKAKNTLNSTAKTIREKKMKLCMFPEGTRHGGDDLLPFKKGAFHVALLSECPLQPIMVSHYYFLDSKKSIFDRGIVNIEILPSIETAGFEKENLDELISSTHDLMNREYKKLSAKTMKEIEKKTE